jgi:tRNA pseudouridine13 synthase
MTNQKTYAYSFEPVPFRFAQSVERFHVEELPLHPATGRGEWLMLRIRKRDLSTWRLLNVVKSATGASDREIGYAGLKDKAATPIQYLTLPARYEKGLQKIRTERIELLESRRTRHPLKMGELRGNRFRILLDGIDAGQGERLLEQARRLARGGIPNYFGYQRFGEDGRAWEQGREIAHSGKRLKGAKERLLVAAWQSHLFNGWLRERVRSSRIVAEHEPEAAAKKLGWPLPLVRELRTQPQPFKLLPGELLRPLPKGRLFNSRNLSRDAEAFARRRLTPTGLLPGSRVWRARGDARHLEAPWDDEELDALPGDRRDAWIWPGELTGSYDAGKQGLWLEFTLPAGSFATALLEELAHRPLAPADRRSGG